MSHATKSQALRDAIEALGLDEKHKKKLGLDLLPRIIERMEQLTPECLPCQEMALETDEFIAMLPTLQTNRQTLKAFKKKMKAFENHLAKAHEIHRPGYYESFWIAIGVAIGASLMTTLDNPAFIGVGVAIGAGVGSSTSSKAKKENRVL